MKKSLSILMLIIALNSQAQKVYYVGHSLLNLDMPFMTNQMALDKNITAATYRHHINIGTALKENWIDTAFNSNLIWTPSIGNDIEYGTNHLRELNNTYQSIVITEAVPLLDNTRDTTIKYADTFFNFARIANPSIKKFMYATWEHPDNDWVGWRNKLNTLKPVWEDIADQTAARLGVGQQVYIVPANIAMARMYDTFQVHSIGTMNSFQDLFVDTNNIHLNYKGNYFIACLMLATVYQQNPAGLGQMQAGPYTSNIEVSDPILRAKMQQIAWETVCSYSRSGVTSCSISTSIDNESLQTPPSVRYSNGILSFANTAHLEQVRVYTIMGELIHQTKEQNTQVDLPSNQLLFFEVKNQGRTSILKAIF